MAYILLITYLYNVVKLDTQTSIISKTSFKSPCYTMNLKNNPIDVDVQNVSHSTPTRPSRPIIFPAKFMLLPAFLALLFGGKKGRSLKQGRLHNGLVCFDSNN